MARQAIEASLPITESVVRKGDPILERTRVKLDRIPGDEVRVVSIGDIDRAACAGVHVRNTGELGLLLITKFTSARPAADYEVEFEVGAKARARALELSAAALQAAGSVGSRPQDLLSAVANLKAAKERAEASLRSYSAQALRGLIPSEVGGVKLYSGIFEGVDKKVLMDAANEFTAEEAVCVLGSAGERFLLVVACHPSVGIDCVAALNEALATVGGKGGGKPNFATGGSPSPEKAEEAMVGAIVAVRKALEARL
jgi:alanyl-tRNA synthetase